MAMIPQRVSIDSAQRGSTERMEILMTASKIQLSDIPPVGAAGLNCSTFTVALVLGVPEQAVRERCRDGRIRAVRVGMAWRVPVGVLVELVGSAE